MKVYIVVVFNNIGKIRQAKAFKRRIKATNS